MRRRPGGPAHGVRRLAQLQAEARLACFFVAVDNGQEDGRSILQKGGTVSLFAFTAQKPRRALERQEQVDFFGIGLLVTSNNQHWHLQHHAR